MRHRVGLVEKKYSDIAYTMDMSKKKELSKRQQEKK